MKRARVIAHLDCDCFYAQVELVRLRLPLDTPLCVVQWSSALAVSYAARPFGIKRGETVAEIARKGAGKVRVVHVQTIGNGGAPGADADADADAGGVVVVGGGGGGREGGEVMEGAAAGGRDVAEGGGNGGGAGAGGRGHDGEDRGESDVAGGSAAGGAAGDVVAGGGAGGDAAGARAETAPGGAAGEASGDVKNTQKVSLARYRNASSQVFSVIASLLPGAPFERASIDEAFVDITAHVEARLSSSPSPPPLPDGTHVVGARGGGADAGERMLREGARVIHDVRAAVFARTGFTMSGGVAQNKMLAKYASACHKPDQQTVVFPDAVDALLGEVPLTAFRGLGGQMGKTVVAAGHRTAKVCSCPFRRWQLAAPPDSPFFFVLPFAQDVRDNMSRAELTRLVGPRFGAFVYAACRGEDESEVVRRREANTVLAAKSFAATSSLPTALSWLRVLADEVADRLAYQEAHHRRYASTLVCSFRVHSRKLHAPVSLNRSGAMPSRNLNDRPAAILDAATRTLAKLLAGNEYRFPISFCGLTGANFVARAHGTLSIAQFCQKGGGRETAGAASVLASPAKPAGLSGKKRRRDSIGMYFRKQGGAQGGEEQTLHVASAEKERQGGCAAAGAAPSASRVADSVGQVDVVARRVQIRNDFALAKKLSEDDWAQRRRGNER